jgi:hypothetical protein
MFTPQSLACATVSLLFTVTAGVAQPLNLPTRGPSARATSGRSPVEPPPEWFIRLIEIATGDPMKGGSSPLSISKTSYDWKWLAQRHGIGVSGSLDRKRFQGTQEAFERLDRNGDGVLDATDFDWSDRSPFIQQQALATALFNRLNTNGDGEVSGQEWQAMFERVAGPKGRLTSEDLPRALFAGPAPMSVKWLVAPGPGSNDVSRQAAQDARRAVRSRAAELPDAPRDHAARRGHHE